MNKTSSNQIAKNFFIILADITDFNFPQRLRLKRLDKVQLDLIKSNYGIIEPNVLQVVMFFLMEMSLAVVESKISNIEYGEAKQRGRKMYHIPQWHKKITSQIIQNDTSSWARVLSKDIYRRNKTFLSSLEGLLFAEIYLIYVKMCIF